MRSRDLVRVPWKNGGGTTAEVAVHPPGAAFDGFDWRISMADVASDGPFSRFSGIDRTLVLAQGRDLTLNVEGRSHCLAEPGDLLAFPGESDTEAMLGHGPIRDINVMSRRGHVRHRVTLLSAGASRSDWARPEVVAVVALDPVAATIDGTVFRLEDLDVMLAEGALRDLSVNGRSLLIELRGGTA